MTEPQSKMVYVVTVVVDNDIVEQHVFDNKLAATTKRVDLTRQYRSFGATFFGAKELITSPVKWEDE